MVATRSLEPHRCVWTDVSRGLMASVAWCRLVSCLAGGNGVVVVVVIMMMMMVMVVVMMMMICGGADISGKACATKTCRKRAHL